ncbi:MAG TPA: ABC transporter permease, partial [bacterium]
LTISMGITVGSIGVIYSVLLKQHLDDYLPYVALGFIQWGFIAGVMNDGCQSFVTAEAIIKQTRLPLTIHVFRVFYRQVIISAHNFAIYVLVLAVFQIWPSWMLLWAIPALVIWAVNALWMILLLGILCARFRDIPPIVTSIVQLMFLCTPVIWKAESMGKRALLAHGNPAFHFMEILRAPLLGQAPPEVSWYVVLAITVLGWAVAFELFRRYRWRIAYWV